MRLTRLPAAYTPDDARPICPRCWSRLDIDWGKGRDGVSREMRGWSVSRATARDADGREVPVTTAIHRCANAACPTAVEVTMQIVGGYVPTLVAERALADADARRFREGRHDRAGVWRARDGDARTTPPQRDLFG